MNSKSRPLSACGWAILHRIANRDTDVLAELVTYFHDPEDDVGERWQFLRLAERDAWIAVELLLLRSEIERRLNEGVLDAWVQVTPLGQEIRDGLAEFFDSYRSVEFPEEPTSIGVFAFQELCAARLAGELDAGLRRPAGSAEEIMERLAASLACRYPLFAQAIRNPTLDLAGMGWGILDSRIRMNFETMVALPTERTPPQNPGLEDLVVLLVNIPSTVTMLIGDVVANGEFVRRIKLAEGRKRLEGSASDDLKQEARAEVQAILGRSVPIKASTLAEAVAIADRLKADQNILIAINSLWNWFLALPAQDRDAIGKFKNARDFWMTARFRNRLQ